MNYSIAELQKILNAEFIQRADVNASVQHVCIDTRKIIFPQQSVFVAFKTAQRNGHLFLTEAYNQGIRNFIVSESVELKDDCNVLRVNNTLTALQQLASHHRNQFIYPVIGITGSNGKTIVKEWLTHLLCSSRKIVRSPRSFNSQIGVPLSVLEMTSKYDLGIFEAGISTTNEMKLLEEIIRPTIGVLTHIGDAHKEGFSSLQEKINEKCKLFERAETVVINADDEHVKKTVQNMHAEKISYGVNASAVIRVTQIRPNTGISELEVEYKNQTYAFSVPFAGTAAVENALCCFAVCAALDADLNEVCERMNNLPQQEMRLQMQKALQDSVVINDSYSFDLSSLQTALDFLAQQKKTYNTTVILSDLPADGTEDYTQVLQMLKERKIQRCILVGPKWNAHKHAADQISVAEYYDDTENFIHHFKASSYHHEIILIKGAREFKFDELAELFLKQVHQTVLKINMSAMIHNLNAFKLLLKPDTKIMAMVKAFGYGSGGSEPAKLLQYHGVDYLAVAYADEGVQLRKEGISLPIMVLNPDEAAFHSLIEYNLEPELFSFPILKSFLQFLQQQGLQYYPVHIKLDTGMHRLGFEENDMEELGDVLRKTNAINIKSVFTHLAAGEDPDMDAFTLLQYDQFKKMSAFIRAAIEYDFIEHISNSAAILRHRQLDSGMVRLGIGLYGVKPANSDVQLKTVAYWNTTVAQIRNVKAGDTIGYNRKGEVERDSVIATLRVGYADGFRRSLGNGRGKVFIKGKFAPVIGNVCMDMIMVDITDIPDVQSNDEAEIIGENISVEWMAEACDTIAYEILTGVSGRVKRVYLME